MSLKSVTIAILTVTAIGAAIIHAYSGFGSDKPCYHLSEIVARNKTGDVVEFVLDRCSGPAFSATGTLRLRRKGDQSATSFFAYSELNESPHVTWADDGHIVVSLRRLDHIFTQKRMVDGVPIQYRIGTIVTR